jgi:transcriptional regulator with XRE-family HTH domain
MDQNGPDNLRTILLQWSKDRKISINRWAKEAGIGESLLRNFLAGRSNTLTYNTLENLASAIEVSVPRLLTKQVPDENLVPIHYHIKADVINPDYAIRFGTLGTIALPIDERYPGIPRVAAKILDDSFSNYYNINDIVIYASYDNIESKPKNGDHVVCVEHMSDERGMPADILGRAAARVSIREVVLEGDSMWLMLRSRSPRWSQHIHILSDAGLHDGSTPLFAYATASSTVWIEGKVVASYRHE